MVFGSDGMELVYILLAILAGVFTTIESSINSQLGKYISPNVAALHSLIVGLLFMLFLTIMKGNLGRYASITKVSPIWLIGGVFGASIIYLSAKAIPELGISNTIILILAGQLLSGLVIDALAFDAEFSFKKMLGMILFLIGAIIFIRE